MDYSLFWSDWNFSPQFKESVLLIINSLESSLSIYQIIFSKFVLDFLRLKFYESQGSPN